MYFWRFQFSSILFLLSGCISWRILDLICGKNKKKFSRIVRREESEQRKKKRKNMYGKCENVINDAVRKVGERLRHRWQRWQSGWSTSGTAVLGATGCTEGRRGVQVQGCPLKTSFYCKPDSLDRYFWASKNTNTNTRAAQRNTFAHTQTHT